MLKKPKITYLLVLINKFLFEKETNINNFNILVGFFLSRKKIFVNVNYMSFNTLNLKKEYFDSTFDSSSLSFIILKLLRLKTKTQIFKKNYKNLIRFNSENTFYRLIFFNFFFKYNFLSLTYTLSKIYYFYPSSIEFNFLLFLTIFLKPTLKKKKVLLLRPFLLISQFKGLLRNLKHIRFRNKRKYALNFFSKKKPIFFIKFRLRLFKRFRWKKKKFKFRKKWKNYRVLLHSLKYRIRRYLNPILLTGLKKKKFFSNTSSCLSQNNTLKKNNWNYNLNLTPFNTLTLSNKIFIFKNLNIFKNKYFPKLFIFFISSFLEKLLKQKLFIKMYTNPTLSVFERLWVNYFSKKFFYFQRQFRGVLHLNELVYILLLTFKFKDLFFLKNWLINFLEKISLKKHKNFIRGFKRLILEILNSSSSFLRIKGFLFDIRGKVGVSGNAKKRHIAIKYKSFGFTQITLKAEQLKFVVRTNTGVLGLTLILTY